MLMCSKWSMFLSLVLIIVSNIYGCMQPSEVNTEITTCCNTVKSIQNWFPEVAEFFRDTIIKTNNTDSACVVCQAHSRHFGEAVSFSHCNCSMK